MMSNKLVWINGSPRPDQESCSHKMIQYFTKALENHFKTLSKFCTIRITF